MGTHGMNMVIHLIIIVKKLNILPLSLEFCFALPFVDAKHGWKII